MASKHLFVAAEIGLFEHIADSGSTLDELSERTHVPRRTLRMIAAAMVALGFVERRGDLYLNGPVAATFLAGHTPADLRPTMRFWNRLSYPRWLNLEAAVRTDGATTKEYHGGFTPEDQRVFSEGVEAVTARAAQELAAGYDFARHQRIIDIGGGTGSFLIFILTRHPHLQGTLFELPAVTGLARRRIGSSAVALRVGVHEGDFLNDPIPRGHDAAILANIIHGHSPEQNVALFRAIRDAVQPGARLLIVDFWTDRTHTDPVFGALMTGDFLVNTGAGDVYSREEGESWLRPTGWRSVNHLPLAGPSSVLVGEAV
jgi:SAM-dependent methyltransferase